MALSQSALNDLLGALRAGGDLDVVREALAPVLQALIDAGGPTSGAHVNRPTSDRYGKLLICDREAQAYRFVDGQLVMPSSKVLHECVARE